MNRKVKLIVLQIIISFVFYVIFWSLLYFVFKDLDNLYRVLIAIFLTVLLSPKIKSYQTQSGRKIQFSWIFMNKSISA